MVTKTKRKKRMDNVIERMKDTDKKVGPLIRTLLLRTDQKERSQTLKDIENLCYIAERVGINKEQARSIRHYAEPSLSDLQ